MIVVFVIVHEVEVVLVIELDINEIKKKAKLVNYTSFSSIASGEGQVNFLLGQAFTFEKGESFGKGRGLHLWIL
jgi:hypothetical protein